MPEPVFPSEDWAVITGAKRRVLVEFLQPESDTFATAVEAKAAKDGIRVENRGDVSATLAVWWVQGLLSRPPIGSRLTCRDDKWYVEREVADPDGQVYELHCVLGAES